MDATPINFAKSSAAASGSKISRQWTAVQDAATAVAMLAGVPAEQPSQAIRSFPARILDASGWRLELAKNQNDDMTAMMQPGLSALLAVNARGQNAQPAALTLWQEYVAARNAVLSLLPQTGNLGPRRSA